MHPKQKFYFLVFLFCAFCTVFCPNAFAREIRFHRATKRTHNLGIVLSNAFYISHSKVVAHNTSASPVFSRTDVVQALAMPGHGKPFDLGGILNLARHIPGAATRWLANYRTTARIVRELEPVPGEIPIREVLRKQREFIQEWVASDVLPLAVQKLVDYEKWRLESLASPVRTSESDRGLVPQVALLLRQLDAQEDKLNLDSLTKYLATAEVAAILQGEKPSTTDTEIATSELLSSLHQRLEKIDRLIETLPDEITVGTVLQSSGEQYYTSFGALSAYLTDAQRAAERNANNVPVTRGHPNVWTKLSQLAVEWTTNVAALRASLNPNGPPLQPRIPFGPWLRTLDFPSKSNLTPTDTALINRNAIPDDLPKVDTHPDLLGLALGRLVSNAFRYSPDGHTHLTVQREGENRISVTILNRARDDPGDISKRFVLDPNRRVFSSGVGLPWAVRNIEKLGGEVRYRSFTEHGVYWVEFKVILPIRAG